MPFFLYKIMYLRSYNLLVYYRYAYFTKCTFISVLSKKMCDHITTTVGAVVIVW